MKKDLIYTFLTEFFVLISGLIVYRLASQNFTGEGFSEYALSRRIISLMQPALLLGLGVGIPRYIAFSHKNVIEKESFFLAGTLIIFFAMIFCILSLNIFSNFFAYILFGSSKFKNIIFPISLILIGLLMHALCYAYYRGNLKMIPANILQILNMSIIPVSVFFLANSLEKVLTYYGLLVIIVSSIFLSFIFLKMNKKFIELKIKMNILIKYGIQRIPADFGLSALLGLPAVMTSHISGVKEAGYVAFSISLLNMFGAVFAPLGLVMLPKASMLVANKEYEKLKYYVKKILKINLLITAVGFITFGIYTENVLKFYLVNFDKELVFTIRTILFSCFGYTLYVSLRSIIDALYEKPRNAMNVIISLIFFVIFSSFSLFLKSAFFLQLSLIISIFLLGFNTFRNINLYDK